MDILDQNFGARSEWDSALGSIAFRHFDRELGNAYSDLSALIGDCFTLQELRTILEEALKTSEAQTISRLLSKSSKNALFIGSPIEIVNRLEISELFQTLLLFSDKSLICIMENCIDNKLIHIPIGQIRFAKSAPSFLNESNVTKLSCFGLKNSVHNPTIEILYLLEKVYKLSGKYNDLKWKLKVKSHDSVGNALFNYLYLNGPEKTAELLILNDEVICNEFKNIFCINVDPIDNEDIFINRLLWRLGFIPYNKDTMICQMDKQINDFQMVLR